MTRVLWMRVGGRPRVGRGNGSVCVTKLPFSWSTCVQSLFNYCCEESCLCSLLLLMYLCVYFLPLSMQMLAETMTAVGFEQSVKSVVPLIGPLAEVRFSSSEK